MSRALLSALSPVLSSRPGEHSSHLPTPSRPSYFRNSERSQQIQQGLPKGCHPPAWQRHGCSLSEREERCFSGDFSPPPLPSSLWCSLAQGVAAVLKGMWKGGRHFCRLPWVVPRGQCLFSSAFVPWSWASAPCSLGASVSLYFMDFRGHCSLKGVFLPQDLAKASVNSDE